MNHTLRQVHMIHVSDLHFGSEHRFQAPLEPSGDRPPARGIPTLAESLIADLQHPSLQGSIWRQTASQPVPLLLAITGDLTQGATTGEFALANEFIREMRTATDVLGRRLNVSDILVVPGNHDVIFTEPDPGRRWFPYCEFYEGHAAYRVPPKDAHELTRVIDRSADGLIIAEINSCFDVRKDSPEAQRGHVDPGAIDRLTQALRGLPADKLNESIKIALIHHHPIVLPALAEPGRGYDAIANAQQLLGALRDFGFHIILHGHKHYPHTFSYDALCAWTTEPPHPLMVIAGGSTGSVGLPDGRLPVNTYNLISFKWDPNARFGRIAIETRGLQRFDDQHKIMTPRNWYWETLRIDERTLAAPRQYPLTAAVTRKFGESPTDQAFEKRRVSEYRRLRGNMLVAEVLPSLDPEQAYEVRLRIVGHGNTTFPRENPSRVEWSAGPKFDIRSCVSEGSNNFFAVFSYYGPMLVQARLTFSDGVTELASIYAETPRSAS